MLEKKEKKLQEGKRLIEDHPSTSPLSEGEYSLEEILAEYGSRQRQYPPEDSNTEQPQDPESKTKAKAQEAEKAKADIKSESDPSLESAHMPKQALLLTSPTSTAEPDKSESITESTVLPKIEPKPELKPELEWAHLLPTDILSPEIPSIALDKVVESTVNAVLEEHQEQQIAKKEKSEQKVKKSKRRFWDRFFPKKTKKQSKKRSSYSEPADKASVEEAEIDEESDSLERYYRSEAESDGLGPMSIGPEPSLFDVTDDLRRECRRRERPIPAAATAALLLTILTAADTYHWTIPGWTDQPTFQSLVMLVCLAVVSFLARHIFIKAFEFLGQKRCSYELLIVLSTLVAAADCISRLLIPERTDIMPYAAISCLAIVFAMWGDAREYQGNYHMFRTASMDPEPPYLVTETEDGACKQQGATPGFYTTAQQPDFSRIWQAVLLPLVLTASLVFAILSSVEQKSISDFLLNWSVILCAGATFALPLCWGLPWSLLSKHLHKIGCTVAGWNGSEKISCQKRMILTDCDLFPPGSIGLDDLKMFGEDLSDAVSYAASMTRAAGCGLARLFDDLIRSEGGEYWPVDDFSFYEEGGYSAAIHGESILMGTESFMRKMSIRLPGDIHWETGIFLSVDQQLIAAFSIEYYGTENVNFALRLTKQSHVIPILASRDPNITPELLRKKFYKGVKVEYPNLTDRVSLSESELDQGTPCALLLREGLLPYAEAVSGSRRLCRAVHHSVCLTCFSSLAGTLLTSYLVFQKAYRLLNPTSLMFFLLLWVLPVLLISARVSRY